MEDPNSLIGLIGLPARDVTVIKSIVNILKISSESTQIYRLVGSDQLGTAHIVFVNGDDPDAVAGWQDLAATNKTATPIFISSSGEALEGEMTLIRPLVLKHLIAALETVTETSAAVRKNRISRGDMKVLVVDDSFPVRKYMEHKLPVLWWSPMTMDFAASGEEAIAKFDRESYDLVFLDVVMPGIDGYKACKQIKSAQSVYVVMLTSKKSPFDKVRGAMSGCDAYITKPPTDERLLKVINDCVKKSGETVGKNLQPA